MRKRRRSALNQLLLIVCLCGFGLAGAVNAQVLFQDDFESGMSSEWVSKMPNQWVDNGWLHNQDRDGWPRDAMAVVHDSDSNWTDYTLSLTVDPIENSSSWTHANVLFRTDNYVRSSGPSSGRAYQLDIKGWENRVVLYRSNNDTHNHQLLAELYPFSVPAGPMDVIVSVEGGHIQVWFDGLLVVDVVDPNPLLFGGVGVHNIWESEARYDNIIVESFVTNDPPTADAGPDQSTHPGALVTLDGGGSSDPNGNYPLTYSWQMVAMPLYSQAQLSGATTVDPTFTPDLLGDYRIELIVTDSLGMESSPDEVLVSTYNIPPVACAGDDMAIIQIGTIVQLDGSQSYDDDGDDITYLWTITQKPVGSIAELSDSTAVDPTFVADVHGDYIVSLVVTDCFGAHSDPDSVSVSFDNVRPVACAGSSQAVYLWETVYLDGSGSYDANGDLLTYNWNFITTPEGSQALLSDPNAVDPTFFADEPGEYIVSLVVNDGFEDSDPDNVTILVIADASLVTRELKCAIDVINSLDAADFKNKNMRKTLVNKINVVLKMVGSEQYFEADTKLTHDILKKTDGCALIGEPDKNDWIITCSGQNKLYPIIINAITLLEYLLE